MTEIQTNENTAVPEGKDGPKITITGTDTSEEISQILTKVTEFYESMLNLHGALLNVILSDMDMDKKLELHQFALDQLGDLRNRVNQSAK